MRAIQVDVRNVIEVLVSDLCLNGSALIVKVRLSGQDWIINSSSPDVLMVHGLFMSLFLFLGWSIDSKWVIKRTIDQKLFLLLDGYLVLLQRYLAVV